jgi:hypothetical protein
MKIPKALLCVRQSRLTYIDCQSWPDRLGWAQLQETKFKKLACRSVMFNLRMCWGLTRLANLNQNLHRWFPGHRNRWRRYWY